jgi:hypothetical protein
MMYDNWNLFDRIYCKYNRFFSAFAYITILPTPKLFFIDSNKDKSLICKVIEKTGLTLHLVFNLAFCCIFIEKQLSASEKPVKNQGFISTVYSNLSCN